MRALTFYILVILMLSACDNQDKAWQTAERDDTPTAYLEFLAKFPDGKHAAEARTRMEALKEINAWERAEFRDNEAGYNSFIEKFPDSEFVADAQDRIEVMQRDADWSVAQDAESIELVEAFLRRYPEAPQAEDAREILSAMQQAEAAEEPPERPGDFRVQLGAFRTAQSAQDEVRRIVELFPDTLMGPVRIQTPTEDDANPMFLLKSVPLNWEEAQSACQSLTKSGQACLVINR